MKHHEIRLAPVHAFIVMAAVLILFATVVILARALDARADQIDDQSYTIKTVMKDFEQANETCKGFTE